MACREGEIRLVGREVRKSAEPQRRLIRFAIENWVAAACRKAIKGRVACHGISNFFEATPPSFLCRKRVLFEMRILGARRVKYLVLDAGAGWRPFFMEYPFDLRKSCPQIRKNGRDLRL